jgi:nicotinate-nucleotide adenylyltransferase
MKINPAIGILGGTFDPIHNGHLYIANSVAEQLSIPTIKFIPCYQPVHRPPTQASVTDRIAMLELALAGHPQFEMDRREIERKGPSYMIDTLKSLRQDYPNSPLNLLLGADAFENITSWKSWAELLDYANFIVVSRLNIAMNMPHPSLKNQITLDPQDLLQTVHGQVYKFEIEPCKISATQVREAIKNQKDVSTLVPKDVADFIDEKHLYGCNH